MGRYALHAVIALCLTASVAAAQTQDPDARAAAVEKQMTDAERVQLLHGILAIPGGGDVNPPGVPITGGFIKGVSRLGVPDLIESDASLGIVNPNRLRPGDTATALPSGQTLASTWNPKLAFSGGALLGREARARGFNVVLGPGLNLARNPRNGRNFEYVGEDPLLAGVLAGETIRGIQSERVVATAKHFALNNDETLRHTADVQIDKDAARESDLLAFEIAIKRGNPSAVMCSYNLVGGAKACGNDWLLNQVLKGEWKFPGWVMSDWGAVDDVFYVNAGLDQQSGQQIDKQVWFDAPLREGVARGTITKARVSEAVRRILRGLYAVGADSPGAKPAIDQAAHNAIARQSAREGIVLLKNEGAILPLAANARRILLVGGNADIGVLAGGGSSQVTPVGGPAALTHVGGPGLLGQWGDQLYAPSSPLKALRAALPKTEIAYESGYDVETAAAMARGADVAIVFATQWQLEGWDATTMRLPQGQDALIAAVAAANPNTIVVLETGNPVEMPWAEKVKAVIAAWYPGQQGGDALAEILTGAVNPSGRLPQSWPIDARQNPRPEPIGLGQPEGTRVTLDYKEGADVGYRWFAHQTFKPRYAFGQGLSYTSFAYSKLSARVRGDSVTVTATIANTGARAGASVAQLYLTGIAGKPALRLIGFEKVELAPGQRKVVTITADPRLLADYRNGAWRIGGGRYDLALGQSSADLALRASVSLKSATLPR